MKITTQNPNLARLLKIFEYCQLNDVNDPQSTTCFNFNIPQDSVFASLLRNHKIVNFLKKEKDQFQKLFEPEQAETEPESPAFADLARLLGRTTAFSGVQHWSGARDVITANVTQQQSLGLLARACLKTYSNMNGATPDEYRTTAVTSGFNAKNNGRFGDSGLTFDLRSLLLSCPKDFASVRFGAKLDPTIAYQFYNKDNFERLDLAFDPYNATQQMSKRFYRDSVDPNQEVQTARKLFAEQTRLFNEDKITKHQLDEARSKLKKTIAAIKGLLGHNDHEAEYDEMHFPAGILLANGFFCTDPLKQSSLNQYKELLVFREFLSAEGDATPQQKELLSKIFEGTTYEQRLILNNPQQMREQYLTDYAMYFKGIFFSHQKRVEKLIAEDKIEAALVLAMQADYFSQFTTIQGVRDQLKKPSDFIVFHSETKYQERIRSAELSSLLLFNLGNIIDSDLVKPEDKEDFQRILHHLDMRKINEFFQRTDLSTTPTFPQKILTDEKLDLSKFLQDEETQDLLKPYFDNLDKKSSFITERQKLFSNLLSASLLAVSMAYAVGAILLPPTAPIFAPIAAVFGVAAIGVYAGTRLYHSAQLQQIQNLREKGKEITLPTACKQIIDQKVEKLYRKSVRTLSYFKSPPPNTAISGAEITPCTVGREDADDSLLISI